MGYVPTEWKDGDIITAEKLNKLETGQADDVNSDIVRHIKVLDRTGYDSLPAKDSATLYLIRG